MNAQSAFIRLDDKECESVLRDVNPALQDSRFEAGAVTILGQELSFYPGYRLLDIADFDNMPVRRRYILYKAGTVIFLDGTNESVYALNEKLPVKLADHNVTDYVRFFFTYVRSRQGRFLLTESLDDINWREEPPPSAARAISDMLAPVTLQEKDGQGGFYLTARMIFRDSLFKTAIRVKPNGFVEVDEEELLIEGMPVIDDTLGQ